MTPERFPEVNVVYGEGQPEYLPLPAYKDTSGKVTTCWKLTWRERIGLFLTGRLWVELLTFNQPIQPLLPATTHPLRQ